MFCATEYIQDADLTQKERERERKCVCVCALPTSPNALQTGDRVNLTHALFVLVKHCRAKVQSAKYRYRWHQQSIVGHNRSSIQTHQEYPV